MRTKEISLRDLKSLVNLRTWIRNSLNKNDDYQISKDNMLIIIEYLEEKVRESDKEDKSGWLESLRTLKERNKISDE